MESLNNHLFFCTLTYNDEFLPSIDVNGFNIKYADFHHLQLMFKRIRNGNLFTRPFRFFYVSERGKENGRPHFHILWILPKYENDDFNTCLNLQQILFDNVLSNWSINVGSDKKPDYKPLCTYRSRFLYGKLFRNYDLHYLNPALTGGGVSECAFYVLKYLLKSSSRDIRLQQALKMNLSALEYDKIWPIVKSRHAYSKGFGLSKFKDFQSYEIVKYLRKCIKDTPSDSEYPYYFSPYVAMSFPLSPFYRSFGYIYSSDLELEFLKRKKSFIYDAEIPSGNDYQASLNAYNKIKSVVDNNDFSDSLNLLYE